MPFGARQKIRFPGIQHPLPGAQMDRYELSMKRWYESIQTQDEYDSLPSEQKQAYDRISQNLREIQDDLARQALPEYQAQRKREEAEYERRLAADKARWVKDNATAPEWAQWLEKAGDVAEKIAVNLPGPAGEVAKVASKAKGFVMDYLNKKGGSLEQTTSDDDIKRLFPKARILSYQDLNDFKTLRAAMGPKKVLFLLYTHEKDGNYGHWVALWEAKYNGRPTLFFHDPYGIPVDGELKFMEKRYPKLSALMVKDKRPIRYNHHKLQRKGAGINTCGKHCMVRLIFDQMDEDKFAHVLKGLTKKMGLKTTDEAVCALASRAAAV